MPTETNVTKAGTSMNRNIVANNIVYLIVEKDKDTPTCLAAIVEIIYSYYNLISDDNIKSRAGEHYINSAQKGYNNNEKFPQNLYLIAVAFMNKSNALLSKGS